MSTERNLSSPRKAVYSVTEVAALCGISRARFYDLINDCVMPMPVYCTRTRRPLYTAEVTAMCVRVRESNVGIDGRYVVFYARREPKKMDTLQRRQATCRPSPPDPLMKEMIETLRSMSVQANDEELTAAIAEKCPEGVKEVTFEADLRAIFDRCRRRNVG